MRRASLILFWATPVMAASKTKGASFRAGAAKAMGFVPSISLGGEGGDHARTACGHDESEHVLTGGGHSVDAECSGVSGVDEGDVADSDVFCLFDGEVHGGAPDYDGKSLVGVDHGGGGSLSKDAPLRVGLDAAVAVALNVDLDHVGDAVALDAPEVGGGRGSLRRHRRCGAAPPSSRRWPRGCVGGTRGGRGPGLGRVL